MFPTLHFLQQGIHIHWTRIIRTLRTGSYLIKRVRYYGDDIAAVIAKDNVIATRAINLIKVEYEKYEILMTIEAALTSKGKPIHEEYPDNILAHTSYELAIMLRL